MTSEKTKRRDEIQGKRDERGYYLSYFKTAGVLTIVNYLNGLNTTGAWPKISPPDLVLKQHHQNFPSITKQVSLPSVWFM